MTKKPNKVDKAAGKIALITAYCGVLAETAQYLCTLPAMGKTISSAEMSRRQDRLFQHWADVADLRPSWDGWTPRKKRQPKPDPVIQRYHFPDFNK